MKSLLLSILLMAQSLQLIPLLQERVRTLEEQGRTEEAVAANDSLLQLLNEAGEDYMEEYVWALVDMSYYYSSLGQLVSATTYALQSLHAAQDYLRGQATQMNLSQALAAATLCEAVVSQCYGAIEDCYAGATDSLRLGLAEQLRVDSIIRHLQTLSRTIDQQIEVSDHPSQMRMRLSAMYHHLLYETCLFACQITPDLPMAIRYAEDVYYDADEDDYRMRAGLRLMALSSLMGNNDAVAQWLDSVARIDTEENYTEILDENRAWLAVQRGDWNHALPLLRKATERRRDMLHKDFLHMNSRARQSSWVNHYAWYFRQNLYLCGLTPHPDSVNTFLYDNILLEKGILLSIQVELANYSRDTSINMESVSELRPLTIRTEDIRAHLYDYEVAVEFIRTLDDSDRPWIQALVLRRNWTYPLLVTLGREESLATAHNALPVWDTIIRAASLLPDETLYFSPDGVFYLKGIEYLPFDDGTTMFDRYHMRRLSTTRRLCYREDSPVASYAALYGGIRYNMDSTASTSISYLPATLNEVQTLHSLIAESDLYTGEEGTEESFKALSGKSPAIIHVATHGFYLRQRKAQRMEQRAIRFVRLTERQKVNVEEYAMARSGLLMAGAEAAWNGQTGNLCEDGILTAREVARLDLRSTDIVVLSACNTGLGDVTIDGIAGLQRGFKQAGVRTLIMSLWPVSDVATQLLMTEFYTQWILSRKSKYDAFRYAVQTVRAKYEEPTYWAGFVMLD